MTRDATPCRSARVTRSSQIRLRRPAARRANVGASVFVVFMPSTSIARIAPWSPRERPRAEKDLAAIQVDWKHSHRFELPTSPVEARYLLRMVINAAPKIPSQTITPEPGPPSRLLFESHR